MSNTPITRRSLLKKAILGTAGISLANLLITAGCDKSSRRRRNNKIIELPPYEMPQWQDISEFTDSTLENGFDFDFGEYVEAGNLVTINSKEYSLDSIGAIINHRGKQFAITNLNRAENGISIDLIEGNNSLSFNFQGASQRINLDGREYTITYEALAIPQISQNNTAYFPHVFLNVNGNAIVTREEGRAHFNDLTLALDLREYQNSGAVKLFLSHHHFTSRADLSDDTEFSGLEKTLLLEDSQAQIEKTQENKYNNQIQQNAYFRIDAQQGALGTQEPIRFRRIEKIRASTQGISTPGRFATSYDVQIKERDRQQAPQEIPQEFFSQSLENSFILDFSKEPIETRTGGLENQVPGVGITYPQEMFSYRILEQTPEGEKEFLIRYIGVDTSLTQTSRENIFYPRNAIFTEILEEPEEIIFEVGTPRTIFTEEGEYTMTLRTASTPPEVASGTHALKTATFIFDVEKEGVVETIHYQNVFTGIRIGSLNLDTDIAQYDGGVIHRRGEHRFFLSNAKFSSSIDFYDDNQFTGLKKTSKITGANPRLNQISTYTLANRFNGGIQERAYFRVLADFGVHAFQKVPNSETRYRIIENPLIRESAQFEEGYLLRIHRIEKVNFQ